MALAVLDTSVLYGAIGRDLLLRAADRGVFQPVWSEAILAELARALSRRPSADGAAITALLSALRTAFPEAIAIVSGDQLATVPPGVDESDRHVVAAASSSGATVLVTQNLRHFDASALLALGIRVLSIDDFLVELNAAHAPILRECLIEMSSDYTRPPMAVADLLDSLRTTAPAFVARVESHAGDAL